VPHGVVVTYALEHVLIGEDDVACMVRQDDGALMPVGDADVLIDLRSQDRQAYVLLMALAHRMLEGLMVDVLEA
jgi:hypothetical protein